METKICSKCKETKSVSEFHKHPTAKDGYRWQCKICHASYGKDPQHRKEWSERYYKKLKSEQPEVFLWRQAKHRAKFDYDNIEFSITVQDIVIPSHCPYLGSALTVNSKWSSPSLDRIDSSRGYSKDNIQVISMRANLMKSNSTLEELCIFARGILALHSKEVI